MSSAGTFKSSRGQGWEPPFEYDVRQNVHNPLPLSTAASAVKRSYRPLSVLLVDSERSVSSFRGDPARTVPSRGTHPE